MGFTPASFEYRRPSTLNEALELISDLSGDVRILAGGQSLIPLLKTRVASYDYLIDINGIRSLNYYVHDSDGDFYGPLYRIGSIANNDVIKENFPSINEAARSVADTQIRNMGTIGGNISHSDPGNDIPPVILSLDAVITLRSKKQERRVHSPDFFYGPYENAIGPDEILVGIEIPRLKANTGTSFVKFRGTAREFSLSSAASRITVDGDLRVSNAVVVLASCLMKPTRLEEIEAELMDRNLSGDVPVSSNDLKVKEDEFFYRSEVSFDYLIKVIIHTLKSSIRSAYRRAIKGVNNGA